MTWTISSTPSCWMRLSVLWPLAGSQSRSLSLRLKTRSIWSFPIKQVDTEEANFRPAPLQRMDYPPSVQPPTAATPSCHYSFCKPANIFSGNWSRTSTTIASSSRTCTTLHLQNDSILQP